MTTKSSLPLCKLGPSDLMVSRLGLGCMGMSYAYGPSDETENMRVLHRFLDAGGNFYDTAEIYGPYANEELLGRFLQQIKREEVIVATKFGVRIENNEGVGYDSSPENVRRVCEESLKRLRTDYIDLFYQHRVDPDVPIEDTVGAMAELVSEGKVRALGLSEASVDLLKRAVHIHPIAALQTEYSLWTREVESNDILKTCRELGITFVAYSPLGRGFLAGRFQNREDLDVSDWRRNNPRFAEGAIDKNFAVAQVVAEFAKTKKCTPAQLALAWVLQQGEDIVPIPGTKRIAYLEENLKALDIELSPEESRQLGQHCMDLGVVGARY